MLSGGLLKTTDAYQTTASSSSLEPLVLIVENNEDSRVMLKTLLEIWSYRVAESEAGEKSVEAAIDKCPSLILMDISLSKTESLTTARRMRQIERLRGVPIVFVSGHAQPEFRSLALTLGSDDFLVKPVDFNRLETVLKKIIGRNVNNEKFGGITV